VTGARISVEGGMPEHGHGLPTMPLATAETSPGTYLVEGMKFNMPGWWTVGFDISEGGEPDRVTFNLMVR
jgi:hypothetical protein